MAIIEIKRASERRLNSLTPVVPTGWEGVNFNPPNSMYQLVQHIIRQPEDPVLGTGFHRERVSMQVFIVGEINKGASEVLTRAELVRNHFEKGLVLTENNVKIHVLKTPQLTGTSVVGDRILCSVLIELVAEVYSY